MFRIAIAGFQHESNSFAKVPASLDRWKASGILFGQEIVDEYETSTATIAGMLARLKKESDIEIHPLVFTRLMPMGPTGKSPKRCESWLERMSSLVPLWICTPMSRKK
jgi:microcystin degradation protein MlrC